MTISDNSHFDFFPAVNKDYRDFGNFLDIGPRTTGSLRRVGKRRRESGAKISMRANKRAMSRGELARRASVSPETVRYYERIRPLAEPNRLLSGYRVYTEDTLARLLFIKNAQCLGFRLKEIQRLLAMQSDHGGRCRDVKKLVAGKISDIDRHLVHLRLTKSFLARLVQKCNGRDASGTCRIFTCMQVLPKALSRWSAKGV